MFEIESLEKTCPECGSHGRIENPNWSKFWLMNNLPTIYPVEGGMMHLTLANKSRWIFRMPKPP